MLIVFISLIAISAATLNMLHSYKNAIKVADFGGEYTEGTIGQPRYINPVLASANDADADLCELIFSGLFKYSADGKIVEDLAEKWELSEDKKTYAIKLKNDVLWHDGEKFTSKDALFTAQIISDPAYKSPLQQSLQSVDIQTNGDYEIKFILKEPYSPFLHNLTFKILPEHIWKNILPANFTLTQQNLKNPVGTGPFQMDKVLPDASGFIHSINLKKFDGYFGEKPYLENISFRYYASEDELFKGYNKKEILGASKLSLNWQDKMQNPKNINIYKAKIPQYFSVFFNQAANKALQDKTVRAALSSVIDKNALTKQIFGETAEKIDAIPLPKISAVLNTGQAQPEEDKIPSAAAAIEQSGWIDSDGDGTREKEGQKLEFTLAASNHPQFIEIAGILKDAWQKIGAKASIEIKESSEISDLIAQREYSALLFGQTLGFDPDPYAFWHSSQKNYPGLNLSLFADPEADKILDQIRITFAEEEKINLYSQLQNAISEKIPAIFLFQPVKLFGLNQKIQGAEIAAIGSPQTRFASISKWYIRTKYERRNKIASKTN